MVYVMTQILGRTAGSLCLHSVVELLNNNMTVRLLPPQCKQLPVPDLCVDSSLNMNMWERCDVKHVTWHLQRSLSFLQLYEFYSRV